MKVHIGNYKTWIGPYQLADLLQKVGYTEDECYRIGKHWDKTWLHPFCVWIDNKRKRKVKVKLHNYDTWSLHNTTSLIIKPLLVQLKATNHGIFYTEKEDIPEYLHHTLDSVDEYGAGYSKEANDYIYDEMIWAFDQDNDDFSEEEFFKGSKMTLDDGGIKFSGSPDWEGLEAHRKRMQNGFRLFGKYYTSLWD